MKSFKLSIKRSSFLLVFTTATFTMLAFASLWIYSDLHNSEKYIDELRKDIEIKQKSIIKSEVDNVIDLIKYNIKFHPDLPINDIKENILDYVSSCRLDYGGYIFINTYAGQALVYDGVKIIGFKDMTNLTDPNGLRLYDIEMDLINNHDGGFFKYKFKKLDTFNPVPKMSYIKGFDDWRWIIGAGIYLEDFEKTIDASKETQNAIFMKKIMYIIIFFFIQLLIILLAATYYSKILKKEFTVFFSFFRNKYNNNKLITKSDLKIAEFNDLAHETNKLINSLLHKQKLLERSKAEFQRYLDQANVILVALNKDGYVIMINKKGCLTLEYEQDEINDKHWFSNFIPQSEIKKSSNRFTILINGGQIPTENYESFVITKFGKERTISWNSTILRNDDDEIIGLMNSGIDITESREVEESYHESELKYKLLFEKSSDAIMLIDGNNTYTDCNEATLQLLKLKDKSSFIGKHPAVFSPIKQPNGELSLLKSSEQLDNARRKGYTRFEWLHITSEMEEFYADIAMTSIPIKGVDYLYVHLRDISEKKRQAKELLIAKEKAEQSDRIKGSFLHNMQHEIRTPLNAIIGFTQLLRLQDHSENEETNSYYDAIISSGNQLTKIIDDIINYSQLKAGHITINEKIIEVSKLICKVFKEQYKLHQKNDIAFNIFPDKEIKSTYLKIDSEKLSLILGHLIDNAFKFTDKGSIILKYSIKNNYIEFNVLDTGIGINSKHFNSIFEMFNRISLQNNQKLYGGNGLGLSISKEILSHIGGSINVESNKDCGSTFSFNMPAKVIKQSHLKIDEKIASSTITIATDNITVFERFSNMFKKYNAHLRQLNSGEEAISYCQGNFPTNLMLIDANLKGMNALMLTKAIKSFNRELPLILITSEKENAISKEDALVRGCDNFIYMNEYPDTIIMKSAALINVIEKIKKH